MSEAITPEEFDAHRQAGDLTLTFVGMSGCGKSFWTRELSRSGLFGRISCDEMIERELEPLLDDLGYCEGIGEVARWMGRPYDIQYPRTQAEYLELETQSVKSVLRWITGSDPPGRNMAFDTTGSFAHIDQDLTRRLGKVSTIVHIAAEPTPEIQADMFARYIAEPKPVIWGEAYQAHKDESAVDALARCYPDLLAFRYESYTEMAQVNIPQDIARTIPDAVSLLNLIRNRLPRRHDAA